MSVAQLLSPPEAPVAGASWMDLAACKGHRERREARARRLCIACPVLSECRSFARQHHEYGFWAGESEEDRHLAGFTVSAPIGVRARGIRA